MTIPFSITGGSNHIAYGSIFFDTPGLNTWVVPVGVTSITAVCVGAGGGGGGSNGGGGGGGALAYVNNAAVTSGDTLSIYVGAGGAAGGTTGGTGGISSVRNSSATTLVAAGGGSGGTSGGTGGAGGTLLTGTGFAGGNGGNNAAGGRGGGGGGAGGYTAVGGAGGVGNASSSAATGGGGSGGGGASASNSNGQSGGGVGLDIGSGISGSSVPVNTIGQDGSVPVGGSGIIIPYGAGAGSGGNGNNGGVRILWNYSGFGDVRQFPSTKVVDDTSGFIGAAVSMAFSAAATITIPSFAIAGDIAILFDSPTNTGTTIPTAVVPVGFTTVVNSSQSNTNSGRSIVSYKQLVAGDAGTSITGMDGTATDRKSMILYRPNQPVLSVNSVIITPSPTPGAQATTGANPTNQTISMSTLNPAFDEVILFFSHHRAGGTVTGFTASLTGPNATTTFSPQTSHSVIYGDFTSIETPVNATASQSATVGSGYQIMQSFYLQLTQA